MFQKTLRKSLWLVVVLTVLSSRAWAKVPDAEESHVTIAVHNEAGIRLEILLQAETEASRIFRQSGIELRWLNCPLPPTVSGNPLECAAADFPHHFQFHIAGHPVGLNEFAMGISYLSAEGIGCYADLFFDRVQLIHESSHVNLATILGHGIAHEIGHLLLGTNSHSPTGIMRARWQPEDLASASKGTLQFSSLESQQMRNKLAAWQVHARADSRITSAELAD